MSGSWVASGGWATGTWGAIASSGVRRLKYHYPEDATYRIARRADEDFIELLALILPKILQ